MIWVELIGYCGTALTVVAYAMRTSIRLRVAGILSSVAFLAYGYLTESYPVMLMEMILLPLNVLRLVEMLRLVHGVPQSGGGDGLPAGFLVPHMRRRRLVAGEALFTSGDRADSLMVLISGSLRDPSSRDIVAPGRLVGDALPFLPIVRQSATLVAASDAVVGVMSQEALRELCAQNPAFGERLVQLVMGTMRGEIERLRGVAPPPRHPVRPVAGETTQRVSPAVPVST